MVDIKDGGSGTPEPGVSQSELAEQVFQNRAVNLVAPARAYNLSRYNLFLLAGPTGAGKSTVQELLTKVMSKSIEDITKDQTRRQRAVVDPGRHSLSKKEFKKRRRDKMYLYWYKTEYCDSNGNPDLVLYGIPRESLLNKLGRSDTLLTLTDPASYHGFFDDKVINHVERIANVIPVVITTDIPEDLVTRLEGRTVGEQERERRLRQVQPQWAEYQDIKGCVPHVIINNTPQSLRELPFDEAIPERVEADTYRSIDDSLRKFAGIVNFYRQVRHGRSMMGASKFDIHDLFLNYVSGAFFGTGYEEVVSSLRDGNLVGLNKSRDLVDRIKQATRNSAQVDHVFDRLTAQKCSLSPDGVLTITFDDVLKRTSLDEGKKIFSEILPDYGYWVTNGKRPCSTRRFSLTDIRPGYEVSARPYAIDMKLF